MKSRVKSGFCLLVLPDKSLKRGEDNDRGKSRLAVNRGAVNWCYTVLRLYSLNPIAVLLLKGTKGFKYQDSDGPYDV